MNPIIKFKSLHNKGKKPTNEFNNAIYSISSGERCCISPGERRLIKTFIEIEIPEGYVGIILPRKENYIRNGLHVFQDIILPKEKKELLIMVTNGNIPKSPYMMSDNERFLGERTRIDVYVGDKIANMILSPINIYLFDGGETNV
jgi:dUTPase